jgi:hypothetical protein
MHYFWKNSLTSLFGGVKLEKLSLLSSSTLSGFADVWIGYELCYRDKALNHLNNYIWRCKLCFLSECIKAKLRLLFAHLKIWYLYRIQGICKRYTFLLFVVIFLFGFLFRYILGFLLTFILFFEILCLLSGIWSSLIFSFHFLNWGKLEIRVLLIN